MKNTKDAENRARFLNKARSVKPSYDGRSEGGNLKFGPREQGLYFELIADGLHPANAAKTVGVSYRQVRDWRTNNQEFADAEARATATYIDKVKAEVRKRAFGWEEDVWYRGQVVGKKWVYDSRMLELEAKMVDPAYRERQQVSVEVNTGVIVVPEKKPDAISWEVSAMEALECQVIDDGKLNDE